MKNFVEQFSFGAEFRRFFAFLIEENWACLFLTYFFLSAEQNFFVRFGTEKSGVRVAVHQVENLILKK